MNKKTIVMVGLIGCLLTSMAGITGLMVLRGWSEQGGWQEWISRLMISYPFSCLVVLIVFPAMIPKLTLLLDSFGNRGKNLN